MLKLWIRVRDSIVGAIRNTPVEVLIGLGLATALSSAIAGWTDEQVVARLFLTAFLALCAIFATSASHALKVFDTRTRWLLTAIFGGGISAYGFFVLDVDMATEMWRWAFLAVAAVTGVTLVPMAAQMGDVSASERFWRYNMRLLSRVSIAATYSLLLYAGVALGVGAVDGLFDLSINDDIYGHLFAWLVVGLGTILAVGSLGEVKRIGEPFSQETLLWGGRLGTFLFLPLVLLYLGIMYLYLGKVLTTGVVPSNILSPLALGAGMLGYFGLFVLQPYMRRAEFKPLARLLRAFPAAFLPIVPFGVWAVWQRVAQYGWTEFRYARMAALVCLGIFSLVGAYRWLRKQEFSLVTGPTILAVVAGLGAVGPWGASYVSQASQLRRLESALRQAELLDSGGRMLSKELVEARALADEDGTTIRETLDYLLSDHGHESVAHLSPIDLGEYGTDWEQLAALGVDTYTGRVLTFTYYSDHPARFSQGGLVTNFNASPHYRNAHRGIETRIEDSVLVVSHGSVTGRADLSIRVDEQDGSRAMTDEEIKRPIVNSEGIAIGEIGLQDLTVERIGEVFRPTYVNGILLLH